jgi:hypothetical protein
LNLLLGSVGFLPDPSLEARCGTFGAVERRCQPGLFRDPPDDGAALTDAVRKVGLRPTPDL